MDIEEFIEVAVKYTALGSSVQDQLGDLMERIFDGEDPEDVLSEQNPNALKLIREFLAVAGNNGVDIHTLEDAISEYLNGGPG